MLTEESANKGLNFLTPGIFELAKNRIAKEEGAVEPFRLLRNMLSSQPMCFNLFGEPARDLELATALARALWGNRIARVVNVRFEWAPDRENERAPEREKKYLNDRTAFDVFIEYETADGNLGFIGIETKLSEPFSPKRYDGQKYRCWMTADSPWRPGADVAATRHNQLWRNHLLAWSLLRYPRSEYTQGGVTVVHHPEDRRCRSVIEGYKALLRDDSTFAAFDLDEIVSAWKPLAGDWLRDFERRYLAFGESAAVGS